jgi:hypothetical protein
MTTAGQTPGQVEVSTGCVVPGSVVEWAGVAET